VKLFSFTLFGTKRLQTALEAGGKVMPNGTLLLGIYADNELII
jgi:hypothetical protein